MWMGGVVTGPFIIVGGCEVLEAAVAGADADADVASGVSVSSGLRKGLVEASSSPSCK